MERFIGESEPLRKAIAEAVHIAKSNAPVLLVGETGVGKELFTEMIHQKSNRCHGPLVKVNCAAIQDSLLESDLFGHEKGSFTGAFAKKIGKLQAAHTGTVFLDEISNMSLAIQAKVLRALEYQQFEPVGGNTTIEVNIRIISATNKNLKPLINEGKFRNDLFFRLGVMIINIPPLRERDNDIILLARHFAQVFKNTYEKNIIAISNEAIKTLLKYHWPGNIRELRNVIERAVLFCEKSEITEEHIYIENQDLNCNGPKNTIEYTVNKLSNNGYYGKMTEALNALEKTWMLKALKDNDFVQAYAAKDLGLTARMVIYKMKQFGLESKSPYKTNGGGRKKVKEGEKKPVSKKEKSHGISKI